MWVWQMRQIIGNIEGSLRCIWPAPVLLYQGLPLNRSAHRQMAAKAAWEVYIADSYSVWQRGTNEHISGLIR